MKLTIEQLKQLPHVTYKYLLDKGEDLTIGEVVYLLNKEVFPGKIAKATNMTIQEVRAIGERSDRYIENHKKVVMEMAKFNITQEEYNDYKAQGKSDKEIAEDAGVSVATINYHKKNWSKAEVKPRTPKLILEENESSPSVHEDLLSDLSKKLRKAEARNEKLEKELTEMEKRVNELHAAAEDAEEEAAASIEYMEREQQLMIEANVWKQKALQYEAEYKRQTDTLKEERAEKERYKGEALAFRLALKAVL